MKRWIGVIIAAVMLTGTLAGCSKGVLGKSALADVNGRVISDQVLATRVKIFELFFRQSMASPSSRQQLLDQLVKEELILEQAEKFNIAVSDAQVESEVAKFLGALDRQYQGREQVNGKLQEFGLTNEAMAEFMKEFLTSQEMVDRQKRAVTVSDQEVQAFYDQNKASLYTFTEPMVRAAHVLVPADQEEKAKEIAAKARAGGNFAELAKLYSVDPGSSQMGGDLGYFAHGTMVKEFADAAFAMQPGQISEPVRSQFGWHIVQVLGKAEPGLLSYAEAMPDAANRLLPAKQEAAVQEWMITLEKGAKIKKKSLTGGSEK